MHSELNLVVLGLACQIYVLDSLVSQTFVKWAELLDIQMLHVSKN